MSRAVGHLFMFLAVWAAVLPSRVLGWGPLAHWLIARRQYGELVAQYANLPDAWDPQKGPDLGLSMSLSPYFYWTHAVLDTGLCDLPGSPVEVPCVPAYHSQRESVEPGAVLTALLLGKVDGSRHWPGQEAEVLSHLKAAAKGMSSHNGADRLVHWEVFLGASESETNRAEAEAKWTIHHGLYEAWAEYVLLATQVFHKVDLELGKDFDETGCLRFPTTLEPPVLAIDKLDRNGYDNLRMRSLCQVLRLLQQVRRKMRVSLSTKHLENYGLKVESLEAIAKHLRKQDQQLRGYWRQAHWGRWEVVETWLPFNFQPGNLVVELPDGSTDIVEYDTPSCQKVEWQMLRELADHHYPAVWKRDTIHRKSGLEDVVQSHP